VGRAGRQRREHISSAGASRSSTAGPCPRATTVPTRTSIAGTATTAGANACITSPATGKVTGGRFAAGKPSVREVMSTWLEIDQSECATGFDSIDVRTAWHSPYTFSPGDISRPLTAESGGSTNVRTVSRG
jgi:hypothetical protein